ncbi:hypothetical protein D3C80_1428010 [compost metagenome]
MGGGVGRKVAGLAQETGRRLCRQVEGQGDFQADGLADLSHDGVEIIRDATAVDAQDAIALAGQPFIAFQVAQGDIGAVVNAAVDFDHQSGAQAGEVSDIGADWRLTPDADRQTAQAVPELGLGPGGRCAKMAGAGAFARGDARRGGEGGGAGHGAVRL